MKTIHQELEILLLLNSNYRKCVCCQNYYNYTKTQDVLKKCHALSSSPYYQPNYCLFCYPVWRHADLVSEFVTDEVLKQCYHPEFVPFKTRQERLLYIADKHYAKTQGR